MRRAHDFGDAESLALDADRLGFEDEPPAIRGGQEQEDARRSSQGEDRKASQPRRDKPVRDLRKVALLVLIGWLLAAMAALFFWQRFVGLQPIPAAAKGTEPAMATMGAVPPAQPSLRAEAAAPPPLARLETQQASMPAARSQPAVLAPQAAKLGGHGGQAASAPAAKAMPTHRPDGERVLFSKPARMEDSLEAKVARLEKEVKALSDRSRAASPHQAGAGGVGKKPRASRDVSKVVGMSSTSVWVRRANGAMAELQVGDRFKNDEVIQRIDQQAQTVETDRGHYKVGF
ncbi:hypothetical protein [Chromobacterium vaccinii]|uniref:hypothetical protein n=1 Tax=Chromobacterium vaccinii TaxID=1108595 RepID=UPI000AC8AD29|nr:hypothetical protein [Chromobacterium vaccinii]SUX55934.1 Uncharacterised protein [Chromobacterium vaccinii]